jgi:hypothetical protein
MEDNMGRNVRYVICLLLLGSLGISVSAQSKGEIANVDPGAAMNAVVSALAEIHSSAVDRNSQRILSDFFPYSAHLMQYRARYVFELQGTTLLVSLGQKQQNTTSGWKDQLLPAKGAEDKLIAQMTDRVRVLLNQAASLAKTQAEAPSPAPSAPASDGPARTAPAKAPRHDPDPSVQPFPDISKAPRVAFDDSDEYRCSEGLCAVRRDNKVGFLDATGKLVIPFQFVYVSFKPMPTFHDGICRVFFPKEGRSYTIGYIDRQGKRVFPGQEFLVAYPFSHAVGLVGKSGGSTMATAMAPQSLQWVFIDTHGKPLSPGLTYLDPHDEDRAEGFEDQLPLSDGLVRMYYGHTTMNGPPHTGFGYLNTAGKWVIDHHFERAHSFHDGAAWVFDHGEQKWGAIDKTGAQIVPFIYQNEPGPFSEGLAAVYNREGKACYIDKTGAIRIPCQYDGPVSPFRDGHVIVHSNAERHTYVVDKEGNRVKTLDWAVCDNTTMRSDGLYCTAQWTRTVLGQRPVVGLLKPDGEVAIAPGHFLFIGEFHDGLAYAAVSPQEGRNLVQGFINDKFEFVAIREDQQF